MPARLAAELVAGQFPSLAGARIAPFGEGWDNVAYLLADRWVFRFPRRAIAVPLIRHESAVLPWLAPRLPVRVPVPRFVGRPTDAYPWVFAGYEHLPGTTVDRAHPDPDARVALAVPLATFLRALHDVPFAEARAWGAPADQLARLDATARVPVVAERLARLANARPSLDQEALTPVLDAVPSSWRPRDDVLVHGDLYARHVLVDEGHALAGVIDWGDVHTGDPAVDLAVAPLLLPPEGVARFREAYGPIEPAAWAIARFRALHSAIAIALYGADIGDDDLVREAAWALDNLAGADR